MLAILNGALVQIIISARVLYGMADRKLLPQFFAGVNAWTNTWVLNTFMISLAVMLLALSFELVVLAKFTSALMLAIFILVNLSLIRSKRAEPNYLGFSVPMAVPVPALLSTITLFVQQLWAQFLRKQAPSVLYSPDLPAGIFCCSSNPGYCSVLWC